MAVGAGSPPVLLRPMLRITDRIRTATRLAVVVLALLVPGALATGMYTVANTAEINFSTREREGSEVLRPALVALTDTVAGRTPDLAAVRAAADAHPDLGLSESAAAVPEVGANSLEERIATAGALAKLVTEISNESNLALDPDLDSFYVMHAQAVQLPVAMLTTLQTEVPVPADGSRLTAVANQAVLAGRLASSATIFRNDVATATANTEDTELAGLITEPVQALADRLDEMAGQLTATLAEPGPTDTGKVAEAATAAVIPLNDALNRLIDARITTHKVQGAVVLALSIGGFGLALWWAVAVLWRTNHDVRQTVDAVTAIAGADLSPRPLPEGRDEMGDIGRALIVARTRLADQEAALATAEVAREQQLRAGFQHQRQAEVQFRRRTQEIIDESTGVIAEELRQVTEKVGEVKGSSEVIDNRISVANLAAGAIVDEAREAEQVIASLEQSLRRAASMVNLVNGIAGQTRLLALNATIEAARAGDLGYGFTVVADEVKQLATNTAESTDQITQTIHDLERDTNAMSQTITAMIEGIGGVGDAATSLRDVAAEQATLMANLTAQMNATLGRVEEMANLASHLERREHDRIATAGQVTLRPAGRPAVEALLVNVSAGGLRCIAPDDQRFIEGAALDVDLRSGDTELTAQARVVNTAEHQNGQEVGLQFLVSDDGQARSLTAFADRLMEAANVG